MEIEWEAQQSHQSARWRVIRARLLVWPLIWTARGALSSTPTNIVKGPATEEQQNIAETTIFVIHNNPSRRHFPIYTSIAIFITTTIEITQLAILCNRVSHPATIVRHIINQSIFMMCSSMVCSSDLIAMCE